VCVCIAVCCSVMPCVTDELAQGCVWGVSCLFCILVHWSAGLQCVAMCCSVLQCVAVCCNVLQCVCTATAQKSLHLYCLCCSVVHCVVLCGIVGVLYHPKSECVNIICLLYCVLQCGALCCSEWHSVCTVPSQK